MCDDSNARFASLGLAPSTYPAQGEYTSAQYALGDVITVTVTSATTNAQAGVWLQGNGDFFAGSPDVTNPDIQVIQAVGTISATALLHGASSFCWMPAI